MGIQMMGGNPLESFQMGYNIGNRPNAIGTMIKTVMDRYQAKQTLEQELGMKKGLAQWELENITKPSDKYKSDLETTNEISKTKAKWDAFNSYNGSGGGTPISQTNIPGQPGGGGPKPPMWTMRPDGEVVENPEYKSYTETNKKQMEEASKPYGEKEAATIAVTDSVVPILDDIISRIEAKGNIFGNMGLGDLETVGPLSGQSRLGAFVKPPKGVNFGNSFKKGLTVGKGREIGTKLSEAVQIAFEKGGSNLTEQEILASLAGLNPEYKTEQEWIDGIKRTKEQLLRKRELVLKGTPKDVNSQEQVDYKSIYGLE